MDNIEIPELPDPNWPEGAAPPHLPITDLTIAQFNPFICKKCGIMEIARKKNDDYCIDCYKLEAANTSIAKNKNTDWMQLSEELGLALYERQPEENDLEWLIWETYRGHYPGRLPSWTELAKKVGAANSTVVKASQKWSFRVRLQAWARFTDSENQEKRIVAIKEMNEKQLQMAQDVTAKLQEAIQYIDPQLLKPTELVSLFKMSTELERRIVEATPDKVESTTVDVATKQLSPTKSEDVTEIIEILTNTGFLEGKSIGVEKTSTTKLVVKDDSIKEAVYYD